MKRLLTVGYWLLMAAAADAQSLSLAGCGYVRPDPAATAPPPSTCRAAPGQVLVLSVNGLTPDLTSQDVPYSTGGRAQANGIAIVLQQPGMQPIAARILSNIEPGPPLSFTLQIPYDLDPTRSAVLAINKNGVTAGQIRLSPATDAAHVLNACDQTGTYLSILAATPQATGCLPIVLGPQFLVFAGRPAHPGDTVAMWAYGLGVVGPLGMFGLRPVQQPMQLNFNFQPNTLAPTSGGLAGVPIFASGSGDSGLYQVNFTLPAVPEGVTLTPCDGTQITSNLTITLSGPASSDAAPICVAQ